MSYFVVYQTTPDGPLKAISVSGIHDIDKAIHQETGLPLHSVNCYCPLGATTTAEEAIEEARASGRQIYRDPKHMLKIYNDMQWNMARTVHISKTPKLPALHHT
jgi:hypothetical protein